jgi:hypothetical protein
MKSSFLQQHLRTLHNWLAYPHKISLNYGILEALKWLALILMTGDHINHVIYEDFLKTPVPILSNMGRSVLPLFAFALAYSLAQPQAIVKKVYQRVSIRLLITSLIACIPYVALRGWSPLNILFTLLLSTVIARLLLIRNNEYSRMWGMILFIVLGVFCEYAWFGIFVFLCSWQYCRKPCRGTFILWVLSLCILYPMNGNFYALAAIPIIYLFSWLKISAPRVRYIFYVYYPIHLSCIWLYLQYIL